MTSPLPIGKTYRRAALTGGGVVALVVGGVSLLVGQVSGFEAPRMLEAALPTIRFLTASVMTAAATTLALLLTLLSMGRSSDADLDDSFYDQVRQTARLAVAAFVGASILLTAIVIPFGDQSNISTTVYMVLYYAFTIGTALVTGTLVAVVVTLYRTIDELIEVICSGTSRFLSDDEGEAA